MKSFIDFIAEDGWDSLYNVREEIIRITNIIYNMEGKEIEDSKDTLLELKKVLDDKLTGS
jgi:hypothetical protein